MTNLSFRWSAYLVFFFLSLVVAFVLLKQGSAAQGSARIQYHVLENLSLDNSARLEAELNAYGQTGWDLVLVDMGNVTKPAPRFILKRVEVP